MSAEDAGAELAGGAGAVVLLHLAAVGDGIGDSEVDAPGPTTTISIVWIGICHTKRDHER